MDVSPLRFLWSTPKKKIEWKSSADSKKSNSSKYRRRVAERKKKKKGKIQLYFKKNRGVECLYQNQSGIIKERESEKISKRRLLSSHLGSLAPEAGRPVWEILRAALARPPRPVRRAGAAAPAESAPAAPAVRRPAAEAPTPSTATKPVAPSPHFLPQSNVVVTHASIRIQWLVLLPESPGKLALVPQIARRISQKRGWRAQKELGPVHLSGIALSLSLSLS